MKNYFFLFLIPYSLFLIPCNAQSKLGNEWINGRGAKVKFINNTIITKYNVLANNHYFQKGNSNICDTNGNLILCSDGFHIYDSNAILIDGGDSLVPAHYSSHHGGWSAASQSSIFLPMDSNKYYFVTPSNSEGNLCYSCHNDVLYYAVINMNANGGAGKVLKRMQPLMENAELRKTQMMACRHANGKDWWLLKQAGDSNTICKFLFTQDSVYNMGFQQFDYPIWGIWDIRGQSTFSSDGRKYATTSHSMGTGKIFLADFDRCYGFISNPKEIIMPTGSQHKPDTTITEKLSVGLAFSPNGEILYAISICNIYQYDIQNNTWFHVAGLDTTIQQFQNYDASYLGPDNKLYIGNFAGLSKQMSVINNPDVKGAGCNFCPRCLRFDSLGIYAAASTPPCMPNYSLGVDSCWPLSIPTPPNEIAESFGIYPNPASNMLYIKSSSNSKRELYNSIGQLLFTTKQNEINITKYSKGIYYIKVENEVKKVVFE
jgi:hypothetical protein